MSARTPIVTRILGRFRRPKQTAWAYCPNCKRDLCSNPKATFTDTDLVRYRCDCGWMSDWLFDAPVPILVHGLVRSPTTTPVIGNWKDDFAPFSERELLIMAHVAREWRTRGTDA